MDKQPILAEPRSFDKKYFECYDQSIDKSIFNKDISQNVIKLENVVVSNSFFTCLVDSTKFPCYFHKGQTSRLFVFLSSGHADPIHFHRISYINLIKDHCLFIDDPIHLGENGLKPQFNGWFLGTIDNDYYIKVSDILLHYSSLLSVNIKDIVVFGSSSGGTAALHICSWMQNNTRYQPFPISINPQILPDINKYTIDYECVGGFTISDFKDRSDTMQAISKLNNGLILYNACEPTDYKQVTKYFGPNIRNGLNVTANYFLWIYNAWGIPGSVPAHGCVDTPELFLLLDNMVSKLIDRDVDYNLAQIISRCWYTFWKEKLDCKLSIIDFMLGSDCKNVQIDALNLLKKHNDCPYAFIRLSNIYEKGDIVEKNVDLAIEWMERASKYGIVNANSELLRLYWKKNTPGTMNSFLKLATTLSSKGDYNSMMLLGRYYFKRCVDANHLELAAFWMRKASKKISWAVNELFDILWEIDTVDSLNEMIEIITIHANAGDRNAMGRLGKAYYCGKGVETNYLIARDWFNKAYSLGLEWVKPYLDEM